MAKRKKREEKEKDDPFVGLFLALMIILLAFFIMLNSIAELESDKIERALRSIQASNAGIGLFGHGVGIDENSKSAGGKKVEIVSMDKMHDLIQQSLVKWGKGQEFVDSHEDERRMIISLGEAAVFSKGTKTMHPRIFPLLDGLGDLIKSMKIPLVVQGHSDSSGSKKSSTKNWVLSAKRAQEVARYLVDATGVPVKLVEAEAFSDSRPIADNNTELGRERNRRVDLVFYKNRMNGN